MTHVFSGTHPNVKALYLLTHLVFILWLSHPLYLLTALASLLFIIIAGDGGRGLLQSGKGILVLGAVVLVMNPLFSSRGATILFYFRDRPVTKESIAYGAVFALMLITMMVFFQAGRQLFTTDQFLYLTGSFLPRTALMLVMVLRLIPLLKRRMKEISIVAKSLGLPEDQTRLSRIRTAMGQLNTLLVWTLEESLHTAVAMRASGYGTGPRSSYHPYTMQNRDWQTLFLVSILCAGVMMGAWQGMGRMVFYPRITGMSISVFHLAAYALWCMVPPLIEAMEMIRWQTISWNR